MKKESNEMEFMFYCLAVLTSRFPKAHKTLAIGNDIENNRLTPEVLAGYLLAQPAFGRVSVREITDLFPWAAKYFLKNI